MQDPCNAPNIKIYTFISVCSLLGGGRVEEDCGERVIELWSADSTDGGKEGKAGRVPSQVSGFRVQAINEDRRHNPRPPPACRNRASCDQAPATASFLNSEPSPPE